MKNKSRQTRTKLIALSATSGAILLSAFTIAAAQTPTTISYTTSRVLGDQTSIESAKHEQEQVQELEKKTQEQAQHTQEQQTQGRSVESRPAIELKRPDGTSTEINFQRDGQMREVEVQQNGNKLKLKREDNGKVKIETESKAALLRLQIENGTVKAHTEDAQGKSRDVGTKDKTEIEDLMGEKGVHFASEDGKLTLEQRGVKTRSNLPLSVDPTTKQLVVTTPNGEKQVSVLPDDAITRMVQSGIFSPTASGAATSEPIATRAVQLEMHDGSLVYRIDGKKDLKLFGLIPVTTQTTAFVSPETGSIVSQNQSLLTNILRFFSR